nr:serine/arginine repetitive matrix protein 5-like [Lytechinus pictus]
MPGTRDYEYYSSSSSSDESYHTIDRHHRWRNERKVSHRYNNRLDSSERRNPRLMEDRDHSPQRSRHYRNARGNAVSRDGRQGEEHNYKRHRDYIDRSRSRRNRRDRSISPRHDYRGDNCYSSETPLRGECDRHRYDLSRSDHHHRSPLRRSGRSRRESPQKYRDHHYNYYDTQYNSPLRGRGDCHYDYDYRRHDPSPPRREKRYESPHYYRDDYEYDYYDRNESPHRRRGDDRESHSHRYRTRSPSPYEERRRGEGYRRDPPRESFYDSRMRGWDTRSPSPIRRSRSPYEERKDDGFSRYPPRESFYDSSRWDARSPSSVRYSEWKGKDHRQSSPRRSFRDPHRRNTPSPSPVHSRVNTEYPSTSYSRVRSRDEGIQSSPPRSSYDHRRRESRSPSSSRHSNSDGYPSVSSSSEEWTLEDYKRLTPQSFHERSRDTRSSSSVHLQDMNDGYRSDSCRLVASSPTYENCKTTNNMPSAANTFSLKHIRVTPDSVEYKGPSGENFPPPFEAPTEATEESKVEVTAHSLKHRSIEQRIHVLDDKMDFVLNRLQIINALESSVEDLATQISKLEQLTRTSQESRGSPENTPEATKYQTSLSHPNSSTVLIKSSEESISYKGCKRLDLF